MADEQVAALLERYKLEYDELTELRRRVDARLAQLHTAITAVTAAANREPLRFEGTLADACRIVLKSATKPMAPTEVRDGVVGLGFQLSTIQHDNPMASIHAVLKRFADSGDAEKVPSKNGMLYRWTGKAQAERATHTMADLLYPLPTAASVADVAAEFNKGLMPNLDLDRLKETMQAISAGINPKLIEDLLATNRLIESSTANTFAALARDLSAKNDPPPTGIRRKTTK
jgi:hypothetical protein